MKRDFSQLEGNQFDVLICGGGIYGAWTAYDAALRGLKVAIVEQGDWASGTSSASSKLIHGGLRYLESMDFGLVKKALSERQMLLQVAPHRVWPLRFGVPVNKNSRLGKVRLKLGLALYDLLAGIGSTDQAHRYHDRNEFASRFSCLDTTRLTGGFSYSDAQTDDARLVLELIDGALSAGAVCLNYSKVLRYINNDEQICGAEIQDVISNNHYNVYAAQVVNTTGQWLSALQNAEHWCRLSKGVHLILPRVLDSEALLLTAETDGRVYFMIPWYGLTLLGTTDTNYDGDINQVKVEQQDIEYLLSEANRVLGTVQWTKQDILGQFAGLRVLKCSADNSPSAVSRDWELKILDNGLLVSVGGKFSSSREDAACIVDKLCSTLAIKANCKTHGRKFPWMPDENYDQWRVAATATAESLGIDRESTHWLLSRHGKRVAGIFCDIERNRQLAERITPALPFIVADLMFSARNEMVVCLEDLLRRRMPLLILNRMEFTELQRLAEITATVLGWDEQTMSNEISCCAAKWLLH